MRILYLTPDVPYPPDQGAKQRNLALIQATAAHHQVDVLSFVSPASRHRLDSSGAAGSAAPGLPATSNGHVDGLDACRRVVTIEAPARRSLGRRAWDLWFDQIPDLAHRLESSEYHSAVYDLLEHERYDVVQIEGLEMISYLGAVRAAAPRAAVIYDAHNAEMTLQRTIWQAEGRNPLRWHAAAYSFFQWSKLGTYERVMMNATDMVIAVSEEDAGRLKGRHVTPEIVPNGVDTRAIAYRERTRLTAAEPAPPSLLFVGPLDYRPNADAAGWLRGGILAALRARLPEARLRLVGRGMERLQGEGVDGVGYVDSMEQELARADALLVPMRMGAGSRLKILEAMAAGVSVVSTPRGLAGIAAEPGVHALVARSPADFASAVERLRAEPELASALASAARRLVEARYDWSKVTPPYLRLLSGARQRARAAH